MNPKVEYTDAFFNWLVDKIIKHIYTEIDDRKLIKIDNYINANYKSIFKKTFRSKEILYMFFNNLKVNRYWDKVVIESDPNQLIPGTTIKVVSIVKLITFGSFHIKGYPIITKIFKYFNDNLQGFYEIYERGL